MTSLLLVVGLVLAGSAMLSAAAQLVRWRERSDAQSGRDRMGAVATLLGGLLAVAVILFREMSGPALLTVVLVLGMPALVLLHFSWPR